MTPGDRWPDLDVVPRSLLPPGDLPLRLSTAAGTAVHQYAVRVNETP